MTLRTKADLDFACKGFAGGPLIFGPMSEVFGRKPPIFVGCFIFAVFQIPVAVAQNLETVLICRFLGGFFAVAPVAVIAGALADMWDPLERALAICVFAAGVFVGPIAGSLLPSHDATMVAIADLASFRSDCRWFPYAILSWMALDGLAYFDTRSLFRKPWVLNHSGDIVQQNPSEASIQSSSRDQELGPTCEG